MKHSLHVVNDNLKAHSNIFVLAVFILITIALAFPFIKDPMNVLISPVDGDAGYSSILFEAIKREGLNPFVDGYVKSVAYPDGISNNVAVNRVSFFSTLLIWVGTAITNAFFTHSILAIFGIVFSAFISYLFVRRVTGSVSAGLVSGLILGFAPIMVATLFSANIYTYAGFHILVVWAYWELMIKGATPKRVAVTLLLVFLLLFWTPYYTFHILLVAGVSTVVIGCVWLYSKRDFKTLAYLGLMSISLIIFLGIYYLVGNTSQYGGAPHRTVDEIYQQSASPLMYILPGATSLAGHGLYEFLVSKVPRAGNTALYLGLTTTVLAMSSLCVFRKKLSYLREIKLAVGLCLIVACVVFLFSLAPTIKLAGVTIPMPSYLIAEYAPPLRAGQRLVMPLLAMIAVLAGVGVSVVVRLTPQRWKILLFIIILCAMSLDLASLPAQRYTVSQPRNLFVELSKKPQGVVATYLHNSLASNPGQPICYYQFDYKMPIINDCAIQRDPYNFDKPKDHLAGLVRLGICDQLRQLHEDKVRYLIVAKNDNGVVFSCENLSVDFKAIFSDTNFIIFQNMHN